MAKVKKAFLCRRAIAVIPAYDKPPKKKYAIFHILLKILNPKCIKEISYNC